MPFVFRRLKIIVMMVALGWIILGPANGFAQNRLFAGFKGLNLTPMDRARTFDLSQIESQTTLSFQHATLPRPHFAGALGFRLNDRWRVEGEMHRSFSGAQGGHERESHVSLMNLAYDFNGPKDTFQPYVSFGAGLSDQTLYRGGGYGAALQQDTALAVQVGTGFSLMLNQNLSFSGDYRYLTTHGDSATIQPDDNHALRFGMTYKLPHRRNIDRKFARE